MSEKDELELEKLRRENAKLFEETEKIKVDIKNSTHFLSKALPTFQVLGPLGAACVTFLILYFTRFFDVQERELKFTKDSLNRESERIALEITSKSADLDKTRAELSKAEIALRSMATTLSADSLKLSSLKTQNASLSSQADAWKKELNKHLGYTKNANLPKESIIGDWEGKRYREDPVKLTITRKNKDTFALVVVANGITTKGKIMFNPKNRNFDIQTKLGERNEKNGTEYDGDWEGYCFLDSSGELVWIIRLGSPGSPNTSQGAIYNDVFERKR